MKIATRTALNFTLVTAGILFLFAYVLYFVSEKNRENEFNDRLGYKIIWRAEFIFDAKLSDAKVHELHERNKKILNEADISVFDSDKKLLFSDINFIPKNKKHLDQIIKGKHNRITWQKDGKQFMAIKYPYENENFYIIGSATDVTGIAHINEFKKDIIIVYFISIIIIFIIGFGFSYYILKPLKDIIFQIRDISEHNLHKRVDVPKAKDEIYELAETFNSAFNRLEQSFNNHKQFVTTISHEFRTPLSILIAELELARELNVTIDDYKLSIENALEDANQASELSSALLDFARANYDVSQISFKDVRIDEVLADAKVNLLQKNTNYNISIEYINVEEQQDESAYSFKGNPYLLQIAFLNVMENACKYSENKSCRVELEIKEGNPEIRFIDQGIGIPEQDQAKIFDLFYRGNNKSFEKGNGIGLSIVKRIVELHRGEISLNATENKGSTFVMRFKNQD